MSLGSGRPRRARAAVAGLFCVLVVACDDKTTATTGDNFSGATCGTGSHHFSIRDATKSISVNGGEGAHFTFKRGMIIGSGNFSSIHSIMAEGDRVVVRLDDAFTERPAIRRFEFRNVPEQCVRDVNTVLKRLDLPN